MGGCIRSGLCKMTSALLLIVASLAQASPASAEWKKIVFRDQWLMSKCTSRSAVRAFPGTSDLPAVPPITIDLPGGRKIILPTGSRCPSEKEQAEARQTQLNDETFLQIAAIEILNGQWGRTSDQPQFIRRSMYELDASALSRLYADHECANSERCIKQVAVVDKYIFSRDEIALPAGDGPRVIYALSVDYYSDITVAITQARQVFAAYRARANVPDDREWSLSPLYGYPARIVPFAVADCGAVGSEFKVMLPIPGDRGTIQGLRPATQRTNVALVLAADGSTLPFRRTPWIEAEAGQDETHTMHYWSMSGCDRRPQKDDVLHFVDESAKAIRK